MYRNTKIATCSYCGTRSALVLDQGRHELVCPACGAPLHEIKAMPVKEGAPRRDRRRSTGATPHKAPHQPPHGPPDWPPDGSPLHRRSDRERARWPRSRKKRKTRRLVKKVFEEAFDFIEDIFD
jgi:transcription initiation factor TFIIIB Brf1 subunit/transcription initiation factor TFIIB